MYAEREFPTDVMSVDFEFEEGLFRVIAIPADDTIETVWPATADSHPSYPDPVPMASEFWGPLLGMDVLHWRTMTNQRGYTDALEMELTTRTGEYRTRFIRIESIGSRLAIHEMAATRSVDSDC
jgi:hypothetical protein